MALADPGQETFFCPVKSENGESFNRITRQPEEEETHQDLPSVLPSSSHLFPQLHFLAHRPFRPRLQRGDALLIPLFPVAK